MKLRTKSDLEKDLEYVNELMNTYKLSTYTDVARHYKYTVVNDKRRHTRIFYNKLN